MSYAMRTAPVKKVPKRLIIAGVSTLVVLILAIWVFNSMWKSNDTQNWQVVQSLSGDVWINNDAGWYTAMGATVWTWPKASDTENFGPIRVTLNDSGTVEIHGTIRYRTPTKESQQFLFHREFRSNSGELSMQNVHRAVLAHLENCFKNTGPMMSSTEHQSARKGEFYTIVLEQLRLGLYRTRRVEKTLDHLDENGKPVVVIATEIIKGQNGQPIVAEESPLEQYGIEITQFSIGAQNYDDVTLRQFAAKKEAFLNAERSKAEREQEIQARLMILEKGKREVAEATAAGNVKKATARIEAERAVEVATEQARQAEEIKKKAITDAEREKEVAQLTLEAERLRAQAVEVKAAAEEVRIQQAGAITERDRVLAEIERETRIGVAQALATVRVPSTFISGGNGDGDVMKNLINMALMRHAGVLPTVEKVDTK